MSEEKEKNNMQKKREAEIKLFRNLCIVGIIVITFILVMIVCTIVF